MLGAGWLTTGADSTGVVGVTVCGVVAGVTEATDTGALALALCLGRGLGRGRSDAFSGANCETSSLLTLWGATCGVTAAAGVTLATGVAARAGDYLLAIDGRMISLIGLERVLPDFELSVDVGTFAADCWRSCCRLPLSACSAWCWWRRWRCCG